MWFIVLISGLSILGWFGNTYEPDSYIKIVIFFVILGATVFFPSFLVLKNLRRAMLITLGVLLILLLRLLGLRDWYYPALLIPILISLEILYQNK